MDTNFGYITGTFKTNTDIVNRATEGILPEHWFLRPGDASNHLMWVAGHLVASRGTVLKTLGSEWSAPWNSLFARGAKLAPPDQYPGIAEVRPEGLERRVRAALGLSRQRARRCTGKAGAGRKAFF